MLIAAAAALSALGCGSKSSATPSGGAQPCTGAACTAVALQSISVSPAASSIAKGTGQPLSAKAVYADGSELDVSASATWTTSNAAVLTLGAPAGGPITATGASVGTATVSATFSDVAGAATVQVTPAVARTLEVNPPSASVATGVLQTFTAIAHFSDGTDQDVSTTAAWSSSDEGVASVTSFGVTQGLATGSATVTASFQGHSASGALDVTAAAVTSLSVSPVTASLAAGTTRQLTAIATFTDGSMQDVTSLASWDTSNQAVATVGAAGLASAAAPGPALASASYSGFTASSRITVTAATLAKIVVTPETASVPLGVDLPFTATGVFSDHTQQDLTAQVTWTALETAVATVSAGVVHPVTTGSTTVSASLGGVTGGTSLSVTDATLLEIDVSQSADSIAKGTKVTFQATGVYSDGSTQDLTAQATWTSQPSGALTFSASPDGMVATGVAVGAAMVTATFGTLEDSAPVTVKAAVLRSIAVTPSVLSIPNGMSQQLTVTGTFSDQTTQDLRTQVGWDPVDPSIATVSTGTDAQVLVTGVGVGGPVTVTARMFGITGSTEVTVTAAVLKTVDVTPASQSVPVGYRVQFTAKGNYSDGQSYDVTSQASWTSSNTSVATFSTTTAGLATGVAPGPTSVTATFEGVPGQATLTVMNATLVSISVTPNPFTVAARGTTALAATGTFKNGTAFDTFDVTSQCVWSSSNKSIAWVSKKGVVTGVKSGGTVTITAKKGNKKGTATGSVQ